jgi:hypothetical protein
VGRDLRCRIFRRGSTPGYQLLHVFGGFVLGMLAMYIAARVYRQSRFRNLDQL